ncbi:MULTISPECIES: prolipoprotein diacylglyceryl transferase [unclassified Lactococcus]|uniref:prolipoprotein diacylglyceryl transferase n=1 Tax=unclassified Lactococcus TaxID=2643510 RepID=UPI0011CA4E97|nr:MULTISPECIES: prolipoprotein diacylglyceryl transferase [unclassified Lactococcus]MQW22399.1 prolipoprotein diacylglyceryl transferase [Lactococcus sp. dk101]TXK45434.1 prolipoprotein diacylglyceryl transferase [Lactococcus sp. dk310]TXK51767.1 prolipoprotein diacylglyceryl transferase [Lactococcus sp. dk322]
MNTIFPFLALSKVALQLGPLAIHWYAIFIVSGAAIAVWMACKEAPTKLKADGMTISVDDIIDFVLIAFPLGLVGVRAYYVAFQWSYYSQHPGQIIALWDGGGAIYGGLIAGAIVLFIFCYYRMIHPLDLLDITVPGVILAQGIGRWGNFVNQEAYGKIVDNLNFLPDFIKNQMFIDGHYRTPTFLYESIGDILGFLLMVIFRHRLKFIKRGDLFAFYLIWYGFVRMIVEGMRTDSLMLGPARVSQWLSGLLILVGIGIIAVRRYKKYE